MTKMIKNRFKNKDKKIEINDLPVLNIEEIGIL